MSLEINIEGNAENMPQLDTAPMLVKNDFLHELPLNKIAETFARFKQEERTLIMPIGSPQAGKSLLLSSLMHYATTNTGDTALFNINTEPESYFKNGSKVKDDMVNFFSNGVLYETTAKGTLDLIGIRMNPLKPKLPTLALAFLDVAGEDVKGIKIGQGGTFTDKINAVLQGVAVDNSEIIFTLITPYQPVISSDESLAQAHHKEDIFLSDFLNYITMVQPQLLKSAKFFIVVSQWDKNPNENDSVEGFIVKNRPSLYALVRNTNVIWGEYSIGKILVTNMGGVNVQKIISINKEYPSRFWNKLYQICTGKSLDKKTWWQKLFV